MINNMYVDHVYRHCLLFLEHVFVQKGASIKATNQSDCGILSLLLPIGYSENEILTSFFEGGLAVISTAIFLNNFIGQASEKAPHLP